MTDQLQQELLQEARTTNDLLRQLISVLSSGSTAMRRKPCKLQAKETPKEKARRLLLKHIPNAADYLGDDF